MISPLALKDTGGLVSFSFTKQKLGMYLEPADEDFGAVVAAFEPVEGAPGEAEESGVVKAGFTIQKVAGAEVAHLAFLQIVALLIASPRPLEVVFKDKESITFVDRFGFPRPKIWCEREALYFAANASELQANDLAFVEFISRLGEGRGPGFGLMRLVRDANGELCFPADPSARLNALSPVHGRIEGISSPAATATNADAEGAPLSSGSRSKSSGFLSSWFGGGGKSKQQASEEAVRQALEAIKAEAEAEAGAGDGASKKKAVVAKKGDAGGGAASGDNDDDDEVRLAPVDIFKRCWGQGTPWLYFSPSHAAGSSLAAAPCAAGSDFAPFPLLSFHQREKIKDWTTSCIPTADGSIKPSTLPIGYHVPPGLGLGSSSSSPSSSSLPGDPAPAKLRQQWGDRLRSLVVYHRGFPSAYRPRLWFELSGAKALRALHPPRYYQRCLLATPPDAGTANAISKDVTRTFPGHPFFVLPSDTAGSGGGGGGEGLASLTRVLSAFAVHNPAVGYCQGLNSIAGWLLLTGLPEEDAFWTLEALANEILPPDFFCNGLLGLFAEVQVFSSLLAEMLPEVSRAIDATGIELHTVLLEAVMCIGCSVLPTFTALRLWDATFVVGFEQALFRLFLALFAVNKTRLLSIVASATQTSVQLQASSASTAPPPSPAAASTSSSSSAAAQGLATPSPVAVHLRRTDAAADSRNNTNGRKKGEIETRSTAGPGLGVDSLALEKAVGATVAAAALLAAPASPASGAPSPASSSSSSSSLPRVQSGAGFASSPSPLSSSPAAGVTSPPPAPAPVFKGGTVRHGAQLFPALYSFLKNLPSSVAAHQVDALLLLAFPPSAKEELTNAKRYGIDTSGFSWDTNLHPARLSALRNTAKQQLLAEMREAKAKAEARMKREEESAAAREAVRAKKAAGASAVPEAAATPSSVVPAEDKKGQVLPREAQSEVVAVTTDVVSAPAPPPTATALTAEAEQPVPVPVPVVIVPTAEGTEEEAKKNKEEVEEQSTAAVADAPAASEAADATPKPAEDAANEIDDLHLSEKSGRGRGGGEQRGQR